MLQLKRSCKVLEKQYFNRPLFYSGSEKVVFEDAPTINTASCCCLSNY